MVLSKIFRKDRKYRILVVADVFDASYSVLLKYSLELLTSKGHASVSLLAGQEVSETKVQKIVSREKVNVVILLRYSKENGVRLLELFKEKGIATIYLIDDDFFAIAEAATAQLLGYHASATAVATRAKLLTMVDYVLCSTIELHRSLERRFQLSRIISPHPPIYLKPLPRFKTSYKSIGYMGSKGHKHDLEMITPAICKVLEKFPDVRFETFGTIGMPTLLEKFGSRVSVHETERSYEKFLERLSLLGWHVGLAPLVDNAVNRCKTFVKFLEYTAAGIPVVASDVCVYANVASEGRGYLASDDDWYEKIIHVLTSSRDTTVNVARQYSMEYGLESQVRNWEMIFSKVLT